jgi:hypothetical protein
MLAYVVLLPLLASELPSPVPVVRADDAPIVGDTSQSVDTSQSTFHFGAALSAGAPSGLELAPFIRPVSWLQLEGALAHDGAAFGLGGGITVGALSSVFTPTLSLGGGHFFRGDMSGSVGQLAGIDVSRFPSAREFDFDHLDAQVGMLFGSETVQLFLRGGASYLHATLHDFGATLRMATGDATLDASDPTLTAWIPSARLGLQLTF